MKNTFKLLAIFMGSLTIIIVGALTGYFLISKNKTFYIYDVRFVEPVSSMEGFIYTEIPNSLLEDEEGEKADAVSDGESAGTTEGVEGEEEEEFTEYTAIKNQTIYMKSEATNIMPIAVYVNASIKVNSVEITSSNTDIAKIVYKDGGCFVQFLREGFVTITSDFHGVKDSFSVQIYDQLPSNFNVYDYDYYGDYAELFPNR